jgi:hypothetical protein
MRLCEKAHTLIRRGHDLRQNKNCDSGVRLVNEAWPVELCHVARARSAAKLVDGLPDNSLVLYLIAFAGHRTWTPLNSDVLRLVRRVH